VTDFTNFIVYNSGSTRSYDFTGFTVPGIDGIAASPNKGGVTLTVDGSIANSTLSVDGNTGSGQVIGNRAQNSSVIYANDIANGSNLSAATTNANTGAILADHALSNVQTVTSGASNVIDSKVYQTFAIDAEPTAAISGSSLSVSDNRQSATAVANVASNDLDLSATSLTAVSALQSTQTSTVKAVSALSNSELISQGSVIDSSVTMSGNRNSALAVINDVANTLSVTSTNLGSNSAASVNETVVTAENVLVNNQTAGSTVTSTAVTKLYNQDVINAASNGLSGSSLTIAGNVTSAEASANRAINTASVSGAATQGASVALNNNQYSNAAVNANATVSSTVQLSGVGTMVGQSTVVQEGNSTTALARGNYASNALNSAAGSAYGTPMNGYSDGVDINANAVLFNNQTNDGSVTATSTNATYKLALNSSGSPSINQSSIGVMGNTVSAAAYGNSANNSMTLNALNTGNATAAIGNVQSNNAAVTATVTGANYGVNVNGGVTTSALRTGGNQVLATAVGNSSVSAILAR
jgi:hypothetical protein